MRIELAPHQQEFCADHTSDFLALIGGFGCGKTKAFCYKTVIMAGLNAGYEGAISEPTNYLTRTHLIPNMEQVLYELKIPFDYQKSDQIFNLHFKEGSTKLYCLSGENYQRLVGYNLAFFGSDETDTSGHDIAKEMWNKAISRVRLGRHRQIYTASTPEGYKFLYEFFVKKPSDAGVLRTIDESVGGLQYVREHVADIDGQIRRSIHATSYESPRAILEGDDWQRYVDSMRQNYTDSQWKVWALGQFGNLNTSIVYDSFNRTDNHSDITLAQVPRTAVLHWGADFNIDHCAAICHYIDNQNNPHAIAEVIDARDVRDMANKIREMSGGRQVFVYPDASGKNRNAAGLDTSHAILQQAGFKLKVNASNPPVGDRVNSMNAMFCNSLDQRRYKVNTRQCPTYTSCLERQGWSKGEPDKSNDVDHPLDAGGYFIHYMYPIGGRPTIRTL